MDINKVFDSNSYTISYFFSQAGIGYYIPSYQREYSWDRENIEQLMDDISSGVFELLNSQDEIHFMGTIIVVTETNTKQNIQPQDHRGIPSRVDIVIDGQQRISTIALLACCLYQKIYEIKEKLPQKTEKYQSEIQELEEAVKSHLKSIQELFSLDIVRGNPSRKPIIIRSSLDCWTYDGEEKDNYKSNIAHYLSDFIKVVGNLNNNISDTFPKPDNNIYPVVSNNIKTVNKWLDLIINAYKSNDNNYPIAWDIIEKIDQSELWDYQRDELCELIKNCRNLVSGSSSNRTEKYICSLVQLFAFSTYLLKRCCFTVIKPTSEVRAFDMFQSLNATGTPLTAIETFKPLVLNYHQQNSSHSSFDKHFAKIEDLMANLESASSKNKRTNDYLNLFALTYEGKSLKKQFSSQRQWLINKFEKQSSKEKKEEFINQMGQIATYCKHIIYSDKKIKNCLPDLSSLNESERKIASFCLLYLKEGNHKMADTILSRFYSSAISYQIKVGEKDKHKISNPLEEFALACKIVAAFFTLWRSALENKGLDDVYRELLKTKMSWEIGDDLVTSEELRKYFIEILKQKGINTKENWKNKAIEYLRYDNVQKVCKFVLFISSNDTISDSDQAGLMKIARSGSSTSYLEPSKWISEDLKTIEHIAPQSPSESSLWDSQLYENDNYQQIGNLTLLPTSINSSASNKGWLEKWFYYRHLGETDPHKLENFRQKAKEKDVELKKETIELLEKAKHAHHIQPIIEVGDTGNWDLTLVKKRTERICDILWDRMSEWLDLDQ